MVAAAALLITALGPLPADPRIAIEAARALAVTMGCESPRVSVAWRGERGGMEITVTCPPPSPKETEP